MYWNIPGRFLGGGSGVFTSPWSVYPQAISRFGRRGFGGGGRGWAGWGRGRGGGFRRWAGFPYGYRAVPYPFVDRLPSGYIRQVPETLIGSFGYRAFH